MILILNLVAVNDCIVFIFYLILGRLSFLYDVSAYP